MKVFRRDPLLFLFTNAYSLGGFLLAFCLVFVVMLGAARHSWWIATVSGISVCAITLPSFRSFQAYPVRLRIYGLLQRRFERDGFKYVHFESLSGGACLRLQHRLWFWRNGIYEEYSRTMSLYKSRQVIYFQHADEDIEDCLNDGTMASSITPL